MKIRMITTAAGPFGTHRSGEVADVPDEVGRAMVAAGAAVEITEVKQPAKKASRKDAQPTDQ